MSETWYSGDSGSETILLFAEVAPGRSPPYVIPLVGQQAYETYQLAVYFRDLIQVRMDPDHLDWTPGYRIMAKACTELAGATGKVAIEDFGSTLMAVIDKTEKAARWNGDDLAGKGLYRGIEISDLLRDAASVLHPDSALEQAHAWQDLNPVTAARVTRCYQASSYGFTSTQALAEWIKGSAFTIQGLWCTDDGVERTTQAMGKRLHLFSFPLLREILEGEGMECFVLSNERLAMRDETFLAPWLFAFDPKQLDRATLLAAWEGARALDRELPDPGQARPHVSGAIAINDADPTFNFGGPDLWRAIGREPPSAPPAPKKPRRWLFGR